MAVMAQARPRDPAAPSIGALLRHWRRARNLSQLGLAHEAEVSPRHLCFLENGRARPSREMVLILAEALAVPLRERNALLLAAGFAPQFLASTLDDPALAPVRTALDALLRQHEPYPAVVLNRHWDIVETNGAAARLFALLLEGRTAHGAGNVLRLMFHPGGLRPAVENWDAVARSLVQRVHREALGAPWTRRDVPSSRRSWTTPASRLACGRRTSTRRSSPSCQSPSAIATGRSASSRR
jgi:transcriptional regulator with XRE-family HTH domain